ncbi:MAG TPA: PilN domain-containing protein [Xanthobacteraceae bacterium]
MPILAVWTRWIEILAGLLVAMHEAWRSRRALSVALEDKRLVVRSGVDGARAKVPAAAELAGAARRHCITLELPAEEVVLQRINVPARAREFLPGIVRNQIERLSPWPADQVVYGFDATASEGDADTLDARVMMTSRAAVEAARGELAALGVTADRIVAREVGDTPAPPLTLWSRFDNGPGRGLERAHRMVGVAVLATVLASGSVAAWALASASALRTESEDVAARAATLQRQLQGARAAAPSASLAPPERAWALKDTAPAGVIVLDTLSQALPDSAYLTELTLQKSTVRIVGLTSDAPALIAPLEHFGQFADVRFFAPTTRGPDGRLFWFHIEARVEPHNGGAED